jgi:hypothetical protein
VLIYFNVNRTISKFKFQNKYLDFIPNLLTFANVFMTNANLKQHSKRYIYRSTFFGRVVYVIFDSIEEV